MNLNGLTRKEFLGVGIATLGATLGAAFGSACSSSDNSSNSNSGGAGGSVGTKTSCADPVSTTQEADATGHTHTLTISAAQINAGAPMTFTTSDVFSHTHDVTLSADDFASLKTGGTRPLISSSAGTPAHTHTYDLKCA